MKLIAIYFSVPHEREEYFMKFLLKTTKEFFSCKEYDTYNFAPKNNQHLHFSLRQLTDLT